VEQRPLHSFFVSFYKRFSQIVGFCSILSYSNLFYSVITWQYGNLQRTGSGIDQFVAITRPVAVYGQHPVLMLSRVMVHFWTLVQLTISSGLGALKIVIKVPLGLN